MRAIYQKIRHALYLYIKRNVEKVWGARYTLGARYPSKNTVIYFSSNNDNSYKHNVQSSIAVKVYNGSSVVGIVR